MNEPQIRREDFFVCLFELLAFRGADAQSDGVPNRGEGRLCKRIESVKLLFVGVIRHLKESIIVT